MAHQPGSDSATSAPGRLPVSVQLFSNNGEGLSLGEVTGFGDGRFPGFGADGGVQVVEQRAQAFFQCHLQGRTDLDPVPTGRTRPAWLPGVATVRYEPASGH